MTTDDLRQELVTVCEEITHEATDSRLNRNEVFDYLKVINSAARIIANLDQRVARDGIEKAQQDIYRFAEVAIRTILRNRERVEKREAKSDPLEEAWDELEELGDEQ